MASQPGREALGKRPQIRRRRQRRDERIGSDVELLLADARTEVQVKAALETLLNERLVKRHVPQRSVLLRHEIERPVGRVHRLPRRLFLGREEVFGGRVVRLGVTRKLELGSGQSLVVLHIFSRRLVPDEVLVARPLLVVLPLPVRNALLVGLRAHRHDEAHHRLRLVLRGQEGRLARRCARERVQLVGVLGDVHLGERIDVRVRVAALL
mmetsp:Transcript_14386/g.32862  ORF Transcript_14386/g.32862 Transcript_14386/m.32862 type:complete len:210 (-) Transcript_14386:573-1202(-)